MAITSPTAAAAGRRICTASDYRQQHPDAVQAQPRDEHLLPLFKALGAAGPEPHSQAVHRGISDHVIAMDSYAFDRPR